MKHKETGNLSREELFEKIKRKCISRSRVDFYGGLMILLLIIVLSIGHGRNPFFDNDIVGNIYTIVLACMAIWIVLYSYFYQKKIQKIDNPSQFLHFYEKKSQNLIRFCAIFWLIWLGEKFVGFSEQLHLILKNMCYWLSCLLHLYT